MKLSKAKTKVVALSCSLSVFLVGCGAPNYSQSEMHLTVEEVESQESVSPDKIPSLVRSSPTAALLSNARGADATFDVVVTSVPVRDLLFSLARDAGVNMDIDDRVGGLVSINALDQTLDAILERISKQVDIRIETVGDAILIGPDRPYFKQYHIDFINVDRQYSSSASSGGVGDVGTSSINNTSSANFWGGIEDAVEVILEGGYASSDFGEPAALGNSNQPNLISAAASEEVVDVAGTNRFSLNRSTGVLIVYAPDRLQRDIQEVLDSVLSIAKRQVLLEATVVEVVLSNEYAQGIDWSLFNSLSTSGLALYQGGAFGGAAAALNVITQAFSARDQSPLFNTLAEAQAYANNLRNSLQSSETDTLTSFESAIAQTTIGGITGFQANTDYEIEQLNQTATRSLAGGLAPTNTQNPGFFNLAYRDGDLSAAVSLLDSFGDARVLSSPRISALNDQPALLRVVDQEVYFDIETTETVNPDTGQVTERTAEITENTVDVGFSMNVLPHISDSGEVVLNLKPSVTRILDYRRLPSLNNFSDDEATTNQNQVPITRVRELESVIALRDGEIAVLGGLLEDRTRDNDVSVPGLGNLPGIGFLFQRKNQNTYKTEFVVFIKARVIDNPSLNGDYSDYRHLLPDSDFIIRDTESTLLPREQVMTR